MNKSGINNRKAYSKQWWHFVPSLLAIAGITYLSLIKEAPIPIDNIPLNDKWCHMVAYMVLALCMASDGWRVKIPNKVIYLSAVLFPIIYGGLIEITQQYFPPRQAEWLDWLADIIGVVTGVGLFALYHLYHTYKKKVR